MSKNEKKNDNGLVTGILFVVVGVIALFVTFFDIEIIWSEIAKLWPVLLILMGVSMIPFNKILKSIVVIIIMLISFVVYCEMTDDDFDEDNVENVYYDDNYNKEDVHVQEFSESYSENIYTATIELDYGAGEIRLNSPVNELVKATNASNDVKQDFSVIYEGRHADIDFDVNETTINEVKKKYTSNHFNLSLNENPIYDFDISLGACDLNFDMTPYKVSDIDIDAGACNIDLKIGNRNPLINVNIETGVSTVRVGIPKSSACRIECESVMINKGFEDFVKKSGNIYETENYYSSTEKINVVFTGAISDVKIYRY